MKRTFHDALGRELSVEHPPMRVVSLVASQTETLVLLGLGERLVGRTRFCVEPRGRIESVPTVGGEKSPSVADILALAPDLVVANKEENKKPDVERLEAAGVPVYVTYPRSVPEGIQFIRDMGSLTGTEARAEALAAPCDDALRRALAARETSAGAARAGAPRVLAFIWKKPWMVVGGDNFVHDMIEVAGGENLGARLDGRYPRVEARAAMALGPDVVLLPDEPYAFGPADLPELQDASAPGPRFEFLDGRILSWFGPRIGASLTALRERLRPGGSASGSAP